MLEICTIAHLQSNIHPHPSPASSRLKTTHPTYMDKNKSNTIIATISAQGAKYIKGPHSSSKPDHWLKESKQVNLTECYSLGAQFTVFLFNYLPLYLASLLGCKQVTRASSFCFGHHSPTLRFPLLFSHRRV